MLTELTIPLRSHEEAFLVLGPYDRYAKLLRQDLEIEIQPKNGNLRLRGQDADVAEARRRIEHLLGKARKGRSLDPRDIERILLAGSGEEERAEPAPPAERSPGTAPPPGVGRGLRAVRPRTRVPAPRPFEARTENQRRYVEAIERKSLVFGVGTAGTGKTFLAVACALRALSRRECRRLVITRPVVEAGEHLGFLPGDIQAKVNPYVRPVYDALNALLEFEEESRLEDIGVIEVAPLAYMRGRTLSNSFVILDEAQNTSIGQMKMFLTRLGEGSRMVVTGDPTQSDLERGAKSGLLDAVQRLRGLAEIGVVEFSRKDIVRHPLVERIVRAYEGPPPPAVPEAPTDGPPADAEPR